MLNTDSSRQQGAVISIISNRLLLRSFAYLGSAHQVFNLHVLWSYASSIFSCFSFMSFLITSLRLSFGLPIFRSPPTSVFSLLHLLQSFSPDGQTISVSLLLFYHLCLPHLPLLLISILFIPIIIIQIGH